VHKCIANNSNFVVVR